MPAEALQPTPTPTPQLLCSDPSATALQVAEDFLRALTARDLVSAQQCFAADLRPDMWEETFWDEGDAGDLSGCQGVGDQAVERSDETGVRIAFVFDTTRIVEYESGQSSTLHVLMETANGRWVVEYAIIEG